MNADLSGIPVAFEVGCLPHQDEAERQQHAARRGEPEKQAFQQPDDEIDGPTALPHPHQTVPAVSTEIELLQVEEGPVDCSFETCPVHILPNVLRVLHERLKKVGFVSSARFRVRHNDSRTVLYRTARAEATVLA
jgi:hypothetical protein